VKLGLLVSGNLGLRVLQHLFGTQEIDFVFTDSGSEGIREYCNQKDIPLFVGNPRNGRSSDFIANRKIDILASANYLFLIEEDLISLPSKLAFNVHGSLLPKYRGRTPHVWAIINNEKETGITAHIIDRNCDTGEIIAQIKIPINFQDTGADILSKFSEKYPELVDKVIQLIETDSIKAKPQDESLATYFGKRTPTDGEIDWNWEKERIYNWIRAQAPPYPGAFSFYKREKVIFKESKFSSLGFNFSQANGTILKSIPLTIKTPNGALEVIVANTESNFDFKMGEVFHSGND
jgi:methionyl-tRNA formyltransferase